MVIRIVEEYPLSVPSCVLCAAVLPTLVTDLNVRPAGLAHVAAWKTVVTLSANVYLGCSAATLQHSLNM